VSACVCESACVWVSECLRLSCVSCVAACVCESACVVRVVRVMRVWVSACVCVSACLHVSACVVVSLCLCVCLSACLRACFSECRRACVSAYLHVRKYACLCLRVLSVCVSSFPQFRVADAPSSPDGRKIFRGRWPANIRPFFCHTHHHDTAHHSSFEFIFLEKNQFEILLQSIHIF
jgi:hypothetical protein